MLAAIWISFIVVVVGLLALDLGVFHRSARAISIKEALAWTAVWIVIALAFNVLIYAMYGQSWFGWSDLHEHALTGQQAAIRFFTAYVLEKSLSIDNIFVIAMIFAYFGVPLEQQHRVLFWGILGAIILRGAMIAIGAVLMARFDWITNVFGALLLATSIMLLITRHDTVHPDRSIVVRLVRRFSMPMRDNVPGEDLSFSKRTPGSEEDSPTSIGAAIDYPSPTTTSGGIRRHVRTVYAWKSRCALHPRHA